MTTSPYPMVASKSECIGTKCKRMMSGLMIPSFHTFYSNKNSTNFHKNYLDILSISRSFDLQYCSLNNITCITNKYEQMKQFMGKYYSKFLFKGLECDDLDIYCINFRLGYYSYVIKTISPDMCNGDKLCKILRPLIYPHQIHVRDVRNKRSYATLDDCPEGDTQCFKVHFTEFKCPENDIICEKGISLSNENHISNLDYSQCPDFDYVCFSNFITNVILKTSNKLSVLLNDPSLQCNSDSTDECWNNHINTLLSLFKSNLYNIPDEIYFPHECYYYTDDCLFKTIIENSRENLHKSRSFISDDREPLDKK
jgi:hypothetical protein